MSGGPGIERRPIGGLITGGPPLTQLILRIIKRFFALQELAVAIHEYEVEPFPRVTGIPRRGGARREIELGGSICFERPEGVGKRLKESRSPLIRAVSVAARINSESYRVGLLAPERMNTQAPLRR